MTEVHSTALSLRQVPILLRGETEPIAHWMERWDGRRLLAHLAVIVVGAGLYGAAMGCWRGPGQALYTAIKFPLILILTAAGNALLNGMLAPLLGLDLRSRQSFLAILMSFAIVAAILGAFSPLLLFLVWNAHPMVPGQPLNGTVYELIKLSQVAVIAFAGVAANLRLGQLLRRLSRTPAVAGRVLVAWLAGNLLLGSQLSWVLRPFFGSPYLPIEFLRPTAFRGNFFETIFIGLNYLLTH